ncbi:MAG: SprT family zinc-dependent metalloprotease [Candidatus Gracilibacteria bacterium]|nr:SprT family zinc-dependent metalloprotease [Candidatus Gracilibacteria bacterium]
MKIIKSLRKTLSMKINEAGELIVKAPVFVSKKRIDEFIEKNKNWVEEKKQIVLDRVRKYTEGERFMYFGEEYELIFSGDSDKVEFDGMNFVLSRANKKDASKLFVEFYKREARFYIENRIKFIANKYDLKFNKLGITSAKTRWGSCSSTKNISFSYRLIMAPVKTVDYVIVHELAHLKEMNHSKKFWDLVEYMMRGLYPGDYKVHMNWLKEHGNKMIF